MYLNLDRDGYVLSAGHMPMEGAVEYDASGLDLTGARLRAFRWDGEQIVLDAAKLEELEARSEAERQSFAMALQEFSARREAQDALLAACINDLAADDGTALRWKSLYPAWKAGADYPIGFRVQRPGGLYKCIQAHTGQTGWEPENVPALWAAMEEGDDHGSGV